MDERAEILEGSIPVTAMLSAFDDMEHCFADCFTTSVPGRVDLETLLQSFYTSRVFKLERLLLAIAGYSCSDADVLRMANGQADEFSAWRVEAREAQQILLTDVTGATRSWLMVDNVSGAQSRTLLYFGSAVIPRFAQDGSAQPPSPVFRLLQGFHKRYSRILLRSAVNNLNID